MASDATIDLLGRLIGFDTTSRNSNLDLIDYVEGYLARFGIASERTPDASGAKSNLFATIGPADRQGYVLSGHTDVVPVDGQNWTTDPFLMARHNGRLYGRGACDMKGFLAVCLALVPEMVETELKAPIHLAFSYDEEVGCIGVRDLLAELVKRPVRPLGCIVGEPTSMQVVIGHKAKRSLRICAHGLGGHSSRAPECVNAVEYAARLVVATSDIGRRLAASGPRDALYDIPHSTAHVGVFQGGSTVNVVPAEATVDLEFRTLPEDDLDAMVAEIRAAADALSQEMRALDASSGVTMEQISEIPGLAMAPEDDMVALAKRFAGRNDHGKVAYGTEAGLFVEVGRIPTVVCGPGSIAEAHKPDEFVAEEQLAKCESFVRALIAHCAA
ncbi:acetylornithine deacetylase [Chelatococcus sambhunathii]|uniref:Acetylornithine deacetylase n=1 Tax=Chelatococcus sambhunathii TaxID=363953 RepID=A0ABU1DCA0_9HYPH|nr:acetylornithine deacetylase [Chelatococcus sambhunathii]MDR4305695.1 acetylornithine deacetylase [Chelatococcus sambhunathii]